VYFVLKALVGLGVGGDITSISGQVTVQCLGVGATLTCSGLISTIILKIIGEYGFTSLW
jgi:hypothetical protein